MFDKMIFNARIAFDKEALPLAMRNQLQRCAEGDSVFYQSAKQSRFDGVFIKVSRDRVQIKCSLHKTYYKAVFGMLDNSGQFTISNARNALEMLFKTVGLDKDRAKITYFEIGLNIPTKADPLQYIEAINSIGWNNEKELFIDANFKKNRQKTTEKSKNIKKVFKVYDKGFEMADRKRIEPTGVNILRIETTYKRQNILVTDFFTPANIDRITRRFYTDWVSVGFTRTITAEKGIKPSQRAKAEKLLHLGREGYLNTAKADFEKGILSEKEYRTIREFIRDWDDNKHLYKATPSDLETEYRKELLRLSNIANA